jgi:hypothetical protein
VKPQRRGSSAWEGAGDGFGGVEVGGGGAAVEFVEVGLAGAVEQGVLHLAVAEVGAD